MITEFDHKRCRNTITHREECSGMEDHFDISGVLG